MVRSLLLAGIAVFGTWPGIAAAAPKDSVTVQAEKEAWYQAIPPCLSLVDCAALPGATPYPENTLHVEITNGQERARTYLAFSLSQIPSGSKLLGGTLTLPLDPDPAHGGVSAEEADLVACLVEAEFEPVRGSPSKPPETLCKTKAPAVFDAEAASYKVDLEPFVGRWGGGRAALAILPSDSAAQEGSTWHVTFPAKVEGSPTSIALTLEYTAPQDKVPVQGPPGGGGAVNNPLPAVGSAAPPAPAPGGAPVAPADGATPPVVQPTPPTAPPVAPVAGGNQPIPSGFAGPGFAYPQVWALPLLLLAGYSALGRSLTKDLYRRA
jgi:hypothetical protein